MSAWTVRGRNSAGRHVFGLVLGALCGLAWLLLALWGVSPYARYLRHDILTEVQFPADPRPAVFFAVAWLLMTVAMMLPTTWPLLTLFRALVRQRPDRHSLIGFLIAGYLSLWLAFGLAVYFADWGLHVAVAGVGWLNEFTWAIGGATILLAGLYQFTPLKYHCLDTCRSPRSFILARWHGRREPVAAFRLGIDHGIYCVGCCWSLMLLMFAVGTGNLGWMLALAAVMAIEKNVAWGRQISGPLGATLVVLGTGILLRHAIVAG